ncbi:AsmA family protein [Nitrospira sp. Ecomares 2.1]
MWIRRILLSIVGLAFILVILVAVGIAALNSQWFLHLAESKATEIAGRQVTIGAFALDFGRISRLRVENLSIANPSWASDPSLASVNRLEVGIDILPLLKGDLVIPDVQATAPVVHLERSGRGTTNWSIADEGNSSHSNQPTKESGEEDPALNLPRIESVTVNGGRLTYLDPQHDIFLALAIFGTKGKSPTDQERLIAEGGGHVGGEPVTIGLSAGTESPQPQSPENPIQVGFKVSTVETNLAIEGTVDALLTPETANLDFQLEGQNLSRWNELLAIELPALPGYQLTGALALADDIWSIDPMKAIVANSDLAGTIRVISEADPIRIEGDLHSSRLDVAQLQGFMPQQQDSDPLAVKAGNLLDVIAHAGWEAGLTYRADVIATGEMPVHHVNIVMRLQDDMLTIESLSGDVSGTHLTIGTQVSVKGRTAESRLSLQAENLKPTDGRADEVIPESGTNPREGFPGTVGVELAMNIHTIRGSDQGKDLRESSGRPDSIHSVEWSTLDIENVDIRYDDPFLNTHVQMQIGENSPERLIVKGKGLYRNEHIDMTMTAPAMKTFANLPPDSQSRKHLSADIKLADTTASLSAMVEPVWPPIWLDLGFSMSSESPDTLAAIFDVELPALDRLALNGSLSRRTHLWNLQKFSAIIGESDISGQATIDLADELSFKGELQSNTLNVASLMPENGKDTPTAQAVTSVPESSEQDTVQRHSPERLLPPWLNNLQGILGLQVEHLVLPGTTLKDVTVRTTLDNGLLRISPLNIHLGGGVIKTTAQLDLGNPSWSGHLQTDIREVDLNKAMQTLGRESGELGQVNGRLALSLPAARQTAKHPLNTDALLDRLRIDEMRLRYDDPALQAKTDLRLMADSVASGIQVTGTVEYRENPVEVAITTGSIHQALQDYGAMPVDATFTTQETTLTLEGNVGELFPVAKFKGTVGMKGPDPARLGEAIGIPLPHLPPYRLSARVHREQEAEGQQSFHLSDLDGTIGDSDIAGTLRVTTGGERPMIFARLETRTLDLDDLAGLIGAPPDPDESASPEQEAHAEAAEKRKTLLPNKPIDFTQLRKLDADVEYRAKGVKAPDLPLNDFSLNVVIQDGHMQMDRLDFGVARGTVAMQLEVNAHESPAQGKLHSHFDHINLSQLLARFEVANDSFGDIGGRATLWMQGESLANWFASADGGLYLTMTGGKIDALLVELAGLDFTESAAVFLSTDTRVKIECAYTDMQARSGIVTIHPFLLDTKDTKFKGHGSIDLRQEKMNLTIEPYPQDFTILSSRGPLHVMGTFSNPEFSVEPSFPSPEFGMADDSARCTGMVDALRTARKEQLADNN